MRTLEISVPGFRVSVFSRLERKRDRAKGCEILKPTGLGFKDQSRSSHRGPTVTDSGDRRLGRAGDGPGRCMHRQLARIQSGDALCF